MPFSPEEQQANLDEALRLWRAGLHSEAQALYAATLVTQGERYTAARAAAFFRRREGTAVSGEDPNQAPPPRYQLVSLFGGRRAIVCLTCGQLSFNRQDITERYCGYCHVFLKDPP